VVAVLGVVDLGKRGFGTWVRRLRQGGKNIGADMERAPLLSGVRGTLPVRPFQNPGAPSPTASGTIAMAAAKTWRRPVVCTPYHHPVADDHHHGRHAQKFPCQSTAEVSQLCAGGLISGARALRLSAPALARSASLRRRSLVRAARPLS
jgi:hypothetical protein